MSKRDWRLFAHDILDAIGKVERYTSGLTPDVFSKDQLVVDGVVRNLEIIGEAVKNIPDAIREAHREIDWKRVMGFRNIVIHAYFAVDTEIVWTIAAERLPDLKAAILSILHEYGRQQESNPE